MAAITEDERIMEQTARLSWFPESGRPGRVDTTKEFVLLGFEFRQTHGRCWCRNKTAAHDEIYE